MEQQHGGSAAADNVHATGPPGNELVHAPASRWQALKKSWSSFPTAASGLSPRSTVLLSGEPAADASTGAQLDNWPTSPGATAVVAVSPVRAARSPSPPPWRPAPADALASDKLALYTRQLLEMGGSVRTNQRGLSPPPAARTYSTIGLAAGAPLLSTACAYTTAAPSSHHLGPLAHKLLAEEQSQSLEALAREVLARAAGVRSAAASANVNPTGQVPAQADTAATSTADSREPGDGGVHATVKCILEGAQLQLLQMEAAARTQALTAELAEHTYYTPHQEPMGAPHIHNEPCLVENTSPATESSMCTSNDVAAHPAPGMLLGATFGALPVSSASSHSPHRQKECVAASKPPAQRICCCNGGSSPAADPIPDALPDSSVPCQAPTSMDVTAAAGGAGLEALVDCTAALRAKR
jgi:hypothetical protein